MSEELIYGNSALKADSGSRVVSWFTPANQWALNKHDIDLIKWCVSYPWFQASFAQNLMVTTGKRCDILLNRIIWEDTSVHLPINTILFTHQLLMLNIVVGPTITQTRYSALNSSRELPSLMMMTAPDLGGLHITRIQTDNFSSTVRMKAA